MAEGGAGIFNSTDLPTNASKTQTIIQDVTEFKSNHGMYPLVQPYIKITRKGKQSKL